MKLERHLKLSQAAKKTCTLRIAFATSDRKHVNQHFGSACSFVIYQITEAGQELVEVAEFSETEQDKNHSKLLTKLELLHGCQAVYSNAVGSAAIQQLLELGIQPMRSIPGTTIAREISELQTLWRSDPPRWLKAYIDMSQRDPKRFDDMEQEGWSE